MKQGRASLADGVFSGTALLAAAIVTGIIGGIVIYLVIAGWPSITKFGFRFLTTTSWNPVTEVFGGLPGIYGSLLTCFIGMLLAVPISIGAAIFLAEMAPSWIRVPASFLVEMLAAIPSVVLGLWGLFVMVPVVRVHLGPFLQDTFGFLPFFKGPPLGIGFLSAGLILAIMATPFITAVTRDALLAVPSTQREAMLALGATKWEMIRRSVLPYARGGIVAACVLGLGRALGETMAVTMVIGNGYRITERLFSPGNTMASKVALEFNEASGDVYIGALVELALILFALTLILNVAGRLFIHLRSGGLGAGGAA